MPNFLLMFISTHNEINVLFQSLLIGNVKARFNPVVWINIFRHIVIYSVNYKCRLFMYILFIHFNFLSREKLIQKTLVKTEAKVQIILR